MLPNFLGRAFAAIRFSEFSVESRGKCCPIFWEELLQRFDFKNVASRNFVPNIFVNSVFCQYFKRKSLATSLGEVFLAILIVFEPQKSRELLEVGFEMPMDFEKGCYFLRIYSVQFWPF